MDSIVRGENVVLSFYHTGIWKPLACAKTCVLNTNSEVGETSTLTSGNWRSYRATKLSWTASCSGLCSYDLNLAVSELRTVQYSLDAILIRFKGTDQNGLTEEFSGYAIVTGITTTATAYGDYDYSVELIGNGDPFGVPDNINPCDCVVIWKYYEATGGEFNIGPIAEIIGKEIDGRIYRDGIEYRPSGIFHDATGTPGDKEYAFNPSTGVISFDPSGSSLEPDETVDIPYIVCGEVEECVAVQVTGDVTLPDGTVGVAYSEVVTLTGTAPFILSNIVKPAWMTIAVSGSNVNITGTPNAEATGITVSFDVTNCTDEEDSFSDVINVVAETFNIDWTYANDVGIQGRMRIIVNNVTVVNTQAATASGSLNAAIGVTVEVTVQTTLEGTAETDITGPYTNSTSIDRFTSDEFTVVSGSYDIDGRSLP